MRVVLAGINIDQDLIAGLREFTAEAHRAYDPGLQDPRELSRRLAHLAAEGKRWMDLDNLTPETLCAAYARISRDPRSVDQLRQDARDEVNQARKSNESIIFNLGHASVAEHAVFNVDVINVSRYVMEEIQRQRLCSYTEKSQRYIKLEDDFVLPDEIREAGFADAFVELVKLQNRTYHELFEKLLPYVHQTHPDEAKNPKKARMLEGLAAEDARYIVSLATETQMGMTLNARNLESLLVRCRSHPLHELKDFARRLYAAVETVAPSVVKYTDATAYKEHTRAEIRSMVEGMVPVLDQVEMPQETVSLVEAPTDGDERILAALLHSAGGGSYDRCLHAARGMDASRKREIFLQSFRRMRLWDGVLREFEHVNLEYELVLSATCFAQMKRHRMATLTCQDYHPGYGVTVPDSIRAVSMEERFLEVTRKSELLWERLADEASLAAPYVLTNAHRRRVLFRTNVRELYHLSRLREDPHAQWDIRRVSGEMVNQAKEVLPLSTLFIGGKHQVTELRRELFGE